MADHGYRSLTREILGLYSEIDVMTGAVRLSTGLRCPQGCGLCCTSQDVEATALECLPLAQAVYRRGEVEITMEAIDRKRTQGDFSCVLYHPDGSDLGRGRCAYYKFRPLVCRLFGFSFRRNRFGELELCACRVAKEKRYEDLPALDWKSPSGLITPVYQDMFMRISSLHPGIGYRLQPMNRAIKEALAYLYWKRPRKRSSREVA